MKRTVMIVLSLAFLWSSFSLAADKNRDPKNRDQQGALEGVVKGPDLSLPAFENTPKTENFFNQTEPVRSTVVGPAVADNDEVSVVKEKFEKGLTLTPDEKRLAKENNLFPDVITGEKQVSFRNMSRTVYMTEGFETAVPPTGWTAYTTGAGFVQSTSFYTGAASAYHNDDSGAQDDWLVTPAIDLTAATSPRLVFYQKNAWASFYTYHGVKVTTDTTGGAGATWTELYTGVAATSWEEIVIDLSTYAGQTVYLGFQYTGNWSDEWYIDDVTVEEAPVDPILTVSSDSLGFGAIPPGMAVDKVLTITNSGGASLNISSIATTSIAFSVDPTSGVVLPDSSLDVTVTFSPLLTRTDFVGDLIITSDATSSPDTVLLGGDLAPTAGGPDAFGYSWANSFDAAGPVYGWIDTVGATDAGIANGDDYRGTIPLPFDFYFYGSWYSEITATTNGWIGMGPYTNYSSSYWTNDPIPDAGSPNNIIAPLWDDWKAGGSYYPAGEILYKTIGTAPNRQFVVIFSEFVRSSTNTDYYTWECILEEGTNNITIQYLDVVGSSSYANNGVGATVGIENGDGTVGLEFEYNGSPQLVYDGEAIQFTAPPPPDPLFFSEYIEGSGNNKALEIYNSSIDTVWLDNYAFPNVSNAPTTPGEYEYWNTFDPGSYILPQDVFVLVHPSADSALLQAADMTSFQYFSNGDDGFALVKGTETSYTIIDMIGDWQGDPGSGWDVAGVAAATANHTLIRKWEVQQGNPDWTASAGTDSASSEWLVFPQDYSANLGGHPDDPCWDSEVFLTVTSTSYGSEINFYLTNDLGDTLSSCFGCMSSYSSYSETFCLADGFYTFWGADGWGDGWGTGAGFVFTDADGNVLASGDGPTSSDGTNWVSWTFSVGATGPALATVPFFDFDGQAVDGGASVETLNVTNVGGSDLTVSGVMVSGDAFSTTTTSFVLAPGATYAVDLSFDPAAPGDFEGYVVFTSDAETSPDTVDLFGYGVDGVFFESFDPPTGSYTDLPMEGWTILDNNGDADSIPQRYKTWYHDDYGLDGSGNMVAYTGYSNNYYADETLITPMISVTELSVVSFWMYNNYDRGYFLDISYSTDGVNYNYITSKPIHDFYEYVEVILPEVGDQYIAFTFAPDSGGSYAYLNFDEVTVSAAPPVGTIIGTVTNMGGAPVEGANVGTENGATMTDAAGFYSLVYQPVGLTELWFDAPGYHPVHFDIEVVNGDTTVQNVTLVPDTATQVTAYYTGFEMTDDEGQSFAFVGENTFAVMDSFFTGTDTILPSSGDYMLVFPDSGETYQNNDYAYWLGSDFIDLTALQGGGFRFQYSAYISTEFGWDYVYPVFALSDGYLYWADEDGMTGDNGGWVDFDVDMSWVMGMGAEWAVPGFVFEADGSVVGGFGAAFDDVELLYDSFFLAPPMNLVAGSFAPEVPLTWDMPGQRGTAEYNLTRTSRSNFTPVNTGGDENGTFARGKGPLPKEQIDVTYNYNNAGATARDFAGYKVYRKEWPMGEPELLATVTEPMYTDVNVVDGAYYGYAVTALYDEGESVRVYSNDVHAGAVTQLPAIGYTEDFEGLTGGLPTGWEAYTTNPLGISWATGDSAAADTSGAFGYGVPADDHTDFAYVTDGRGGDFTFDTWLLSPFLDASDAYSALVSFSGYEQGYGSFYYTTAQLLVRANMGPWYVVTDFSYDHNDGFVDYANDIQMVAAGQQYVQFAVYYHHEGGWNSGGGNGIAVDDLSVFNFAGPTNLVATPGTNVVDLQWMEPARTLANLPATREITAEKASLPSGTTADSDRETCFSHMSALAYFWSFEDSLSGPSSIFAFPEGPMDLTAAQFGIYFPPDAPIVGSTVEMAVLVANADSTGATIDTIYSGIETLTAEAYANTYEVDLTGMVWESTGNNFIKVHFRPMTWADSIGGGGATPAFTPTPLSDDGTTPTGLSGIDSAGVFYPSDYNFDLAICGTPTPPALSFNIYKDGMVVEEYFEDLFWSDFNVSPSIESCYYVAGVVPLFLASDAGDMIFVETERTNEVCAAPVNTPPTDFTLLAPVDGDTLFLTPDNIGMSTMFAWTPSLDPDGEEIWYTVEWDLTNISVFYDLDTTGVAAFVANSDMFDDIETYGVTGLDIVWTVWAGDGIDDVEATNGPRTFYVDATALLGIGDEAAVPETFALHQNYPNPFNPITTIEYDVPEITKVQIVIYNIMGQRIRTLVNSEIEPGYHKVLWNGTNDFGAPVASGMYFYQIKADNFNQVKKLILMK